MAVVFAILGKTSPPLLSRAQLSRCSGFICFRQWPLLLLYPCLLRATFPDSRCKTTPPSCPLHLPKEEKSLSNNLLRVAAPKLSQFIHTRPRCSTSATNYLHLGSHGMDTANRGISIGTLLFPLRPWVLLLGLSLSWLSSSWAYVGEGGYKPWTCMRR